MSVDVGDIVAVGGDFKPTTLITAYRRGVFPWPIDGLPLLPWFCPKRRAVVDFEELHVPRSLARARRKLSFRFSLDAAFPAVIQHCATVPRADQGTWISQEVITGYTALHKLGHAHSVEVWEGEELVGGVYGVEADGYFSAESMFHTRSYASKLALLFLFDHMKSKGCYWCDIQVLTPHMVGLGAKEISRKEFLQRIDEARARGVRIFETPPKRASKL
jgi:leucyl/phenylalanyl-tRNA--protein transferase